MRCPKCGKKLAEGSTICPSCGRHIKRSGNIAVVEAKKKIDYKKLLPLLTAVIAIALIVLTVSVWAEVVSVTAETKGEVLDSYTLFTFMEKSNGTLWTLTLLAVLSLIAEALVLVTSLAGFKKPHVWPSVIALAVAAVLTVYFFSGIISAQTAQNSAAAASAASEVSSAVSSEASSAASDESSAASSVVSYASDTDDIIASYTYRSTAVPYLYAMFEAAQLAAAIAAVSEKKRRELSENSASKSKKAESKERLLDDLMTGGSGKESEKGGKSK